MLGVLPEFYVMGCAEGSSRDVSYRWADCLRVMSHVDGLAVFTLITITGGEVNRSTEEVVGALPKQR